MRRNRVIERFRNGPYSIVPIKEKRWFFYRWCQYYCIIVGMRVMCTNIIWDTRGEKKENTGLWECWCLCKKKCIDVFLWAGCRLCQLAFFCAVFLVDWDHKIHNFRAGNASVWLSCDVVDLFITKKTYDEALKTLDLKRGETRYYAKLRFVCSELHRLDETHFWHCKFVLFCNK